MVKTSSSRPSFCEFDFQLVDDLGHDAFAFGDGQAARGQSRAGHRPAANGGVVFGERHAVAAQDFFEPAAIFGADVAEDDALMWA